MNAPAVAAALLAAGVAASGFLVVYSQQQSRSLFAELQGLQQERDELEAEWGRLRLEQGAWATHGRIERLARQELGMVMPDPEDVVVVRRTDENDN
ncbi:MAG: cell division protein FtsL [Ectothiorhodospiraceae bacterium]